MMASRFSKNMKYRQLTNTNSTAFMSLKYFWKWLWIFSQNSGTRSASIGIGILIFLLGAIRTDISWPVSVLDKRINECTLWDMVYWNEFWNNSQTQFPVVSSSIRPDSYFAINSDISGFYGSRKSRTWFVALLKVPLVHRRREDRVQLLISQKIRSV